MRQRLLRKLLDAPSVWCIRLLCAASLIVTCVLAFARSPRVAWAAIATVLLLLLSAVNRVRVYGRVKRISGSARRPKHSRRRETPKGGD